MPRRSTIKQQIQPIESSRGSLMQRLPGVPVPKLTSKSFHEFPDRPITI